MLRLQQALRATPSRAWLQRAYAAEAAPATVDFDWDNFSNVVTSDDGKRELATLRNRFLDIQSRIQAANKVKKPDWAAFEKDVDPKILGSLRKAYEGLKLPQYDASKDLQEVEDTFGPIIAQAKELADFSQKRLQEIEGEIKGIDAEKERVATTTVDEELAADPETAAQIDKEISEGRYTP